MSNTDAVSEAMILLAVRRDEVAQKRDGLAVDVRRLTAEIDTIDAAINTLNTLNDDAPVAQPSVTVPVPGGDMKVEVKSIRAAVKEILETYERPFGTPTVRPLLPAEVTEGKSAEQVSNSIRSALWSLRRDGDAMHVKGGTVSTKWHGFVEIDQDSPADGGQPHLPDEGGAL